MIYKRKDYSNYLNELFQNNTGNSVCRNITIQITNQCNLRCSYCYEHNKSCGSMNINTAKKIIDTILDMYDADTDFIGKHSKGLVLDFIGGEPLLEAKLIENICDYYFDECLRRNIPLAPFTRFSFATNGLLWFTEDAQHLFKKYHDFISLTVSIDGIQELHDKYRIDQYGKGSFEKAYIAYLDGRDKYGWNNSKMTFTPGSVHYMYDSIKMMIENGCNDILCNFAYEPKYTIQDAKNIYFEITENKRISTKSSLRKCTH